MTNEELLNQLQKLRAEKELAVKDFDRRILILQTDLNKRMQLLGDKKIVTELASAYYQKQTKVEVQDWNAVMGFIESRKAYDILERRISVGAVERRLDAGEEIPGLELKNGEILVIRKAGKKDGNSEESVS